MHDNLAPLYSMSMKAGESLVRDLERQLSAVHTTQAKTKTKFQNWKAVVKQPQDNQANALVEAGMMGFFLDFLFGMPIFSGVSDAAKGMLDIGLMAHSAQGRENSNSGMPDLAMLNALISSQGRKRDQALSVQNMNAAQAKKMRTMVMMMLMMMMQDAESGGSGESGGESFVPDMAADVLRHPKLARFKQNRHSLACIREMFQTQADAVVPKFNAPRCQVA